MPVLSANDTHFKVNYLTAPVKNGTNGVLKFWEHYYMVLGTINCIVVALASLKENHSGSPHTKKLWVKSHRIRERAHSWRGEQTCLALTKVQLQSWCLSRVFWLPLQGSVNTCSLISSPLLLSIKAALNAGNFLIHLFPSLEVSLGIFPWDYSKLGTLCVCTQSCLDSVKPVNWPHQAPLCMGYAW